MRFHEAPELGHFPPRQPAPAQMGYYGAPAYGYGGYGYYGEPDYGWYAEAPELGWYAEPPDLGWYAEGPDLGWYAEAPEGYGYGWYGEGPELGYGEPIEYAEDLYGYNEAPEMVGYGGYDEYEPLSEMPEMAGYGEPDLAGYVREGRPAYNPGCLVSSNVAGYGESSPLEGYVRPGTVNPTCENLTPQPGSSGGVPDGFRPLW